MLTRREFLASLTDLAATGRTILISSHSIAELEKAVQQSIESRDKLNNPLFKQRMNKTIERQQQDLHIKKKQLNELNGNEDADD